MIKKQNSTESQDFTKNSSEMIENAPQKSSESAENSINNTIKVCENSQNFAGENSTDFAKTVDPVSEFNGFEADKDKQISFSLEEDNLLFKRLFPGVLRENVEKDEVFKLFSRFAPKNIPFASIYSDYLVLVNKISDNAIKKHLVNEENKRLSAGSLASSSNQSEFYSKEQVLRMSREQIAKNYDKIRKSQEKW